MRTGTLFLFACLLLGIALLVGLWSWPSYQHQRQIKSGQQAAELGAQLAFMENMYYERTGDFTADFSRLEPFLEMQIPCPLSQSPYYCEGYVYTLEQSNWLLASFQKDPEKYIAFDLKNGTVDCSHAPGNLEALPICSSL